MHPSSGEKTESPVCSINNVSELARACGEQLETIDQNLRPRQNNSSSMELFNNGLDSTWRRSRIIIPESPKGLSNQSFSEGSSTYGNLQTLRNERIRCFYEVASRHKSVKILVDRHGDSLKEPLSYQRIKQFVRNILLLDDELFVKSVDVRHQIIVAVVRIILEMHWDTPRARLLSDFGVEGIVTKVLCRSNDSCLCWG